MLYANGCVFGGKWQDDLKADGVFIDGSNNWTCGTWDGFVALQAVARIKIDRSKCSYSGSIRQGQRQSLPCPIARGVRGGGDALRCRYGHGHCVYDDGRVFVGEWRGDEWCAARSAPACFCYTRPRYGFGSLYMPDGCAIMNAHWIGHERARQRASTSNTVRSDMRV